MDKIKISQVVLVEGKYDKIKLENIIDANIITTSGFSIFNNEEKLSLLRRLSEKNGIIILTDSDPAGFFLRNKLKGMFPKNGKVIHLYIPSEKGKEKRKKEYSKAGLLGVEGIENDKLREIFLKYEKKADNISGNGDSINKAFLYEIGLLGGNGSSGKRDAAAINLGLPKGMSSNNFVEALGMLGISREELCSALCDI